MKMRRGLTGGILALVFGLGVAVPPAATAETEPTTAELGISFTPDADPAQCIGARQQWVQAASWTSTIELDTDRRRGGCQLAFGIRDFVGELDGLRLTYTWEAAPDSDATQCGNLGVHVFPVTPNPAFGPAVGVDTDHRRGGCYLTFAISGRSDVSLDVQFWGTRDTTQCIFNLPQGQWRTVTPGAPVTIGIDTDQRRGGCLLSLRLR